MPKLTVNINEAEDEYQYYNKKRKSWMNDSNNQHQTDVELQRIDLAWGYDFIGGQTKRNEIVMFVRKFVNWKESSLQESSELRWQKFQNIIWTLLLVHWLLKYNKMSNVLVSMSMRLGKQLLHWEHFFHLGFRVGDPYMG